MTPNDNVNDNDNKARAIEIVLGNKNVAEAGSQQINISQNVFNADALEKVLNSLNGLKGETAPAAENKTSQSSQTSRTKKHQARIVQDVFQYKWLNTQDGQLRLLRLYQKLIHEACGWLDADTTPEQWCALFMGEPKSFTMKWKGKQARLKYLFKLMIQRGYITTPKGVGPWEIVGSHFLNDKSKPFSDWNDQKDPSRGALIIDRLAEILNISADIPADNSDDYGFDD